MRKFTFLSMALLLAGGLTPAVPANGPSKSFMGEISDSMCGAKHMMPGKSDKDCALECVKSGSKYIVVDSKGRIYQLTDQKKAEPFAGGKVKVTGTLSGDTITVTSIAPAN